MMRNRFVIATVWYYSTSKSLLKEFLKTAAIGVFVEPTTTSPHTDGRHYKYLT